MGVTSSMAVAVLLHSLLLGNILHSVSGKEPSMDCPFQYARHSIDDIRSKAKLPYLLGGIYDEGRKCPNCKRGGLWSDFCGFKSLQKSPFWHMQLCNSSTVSAAVDMALKQNNAAELLTMTPCDLWPFMRGRTTWIIGDSMSKDLFKALRCFMIEFQDLKTYHATNNSTAMHFLQAIPGQGEPHCAHMPDNTRLCQIHAIEGDLFVHSKGREDRTAVGGVLPLLQQYLARPNSLFIVHFGLWHGETQQVAYKSYLHALGKYYQSTKDKFPHMFFMETPKQHFDSADGDFKVPWITTRKGPWTCQPIQGVSLDAEGNVVADKSVDVAEDVAKGSWRNQDAREILSKYGIPLIPIYNVTVPAWQFHRSNLVGQECSHFCHPSLPQFWLWNLLTTLRQQQVPAVEDVDKLKLQAGCAIALDRDEKKFGDPRPTIAVLDEQERQRSFWDWLFGRSKLVVKDGVLVPSKGAAGSSVGSPSPWEALVKLLDQQGQQDTQQQQQQPSKLPPRVQQEKKRKEQQEKGSRQQQPGRRHRPEPIEKQMGEPGGSRGPQQEVVQQHLRKKRQHQYQDTAATQEQQQQQAGD